MKHILLTLIIFLITSLVLGQSKRKYTSASQCIQQNMMETELTGDEMYNFVQDKCKEYILEQLNKKKKEKGTLFSRETNGKWTKNGDLKKDNKYVGEIENGKPNGHGKLTSPTGEELYLGMYKEGKQTIGYGYYNWQGNRYFGELKNGIPNGYGVLIWMGEKIFGEFRNMKIWEGTTYSKTGKVVAKYVNGQMELQ